MADLISREAALDAVKFKTIDDGGVVDDCIMQVLALAKSKINKLPAVDAVEVVRCKDCKHYYLDEEFEEYGCECCYGLTQPDPMDFCSYGERREENGK